MAQSTSNAYPKSKDLASDSLASARSRCLFLSGTRQYSRLGPARTCQANKRPSCATPTGYNRKIEPLVTETPHDRFFRRINLVVSSFGRIIDNRPHTHQSTTSIYMHGFNKFERQKSVANFGIEKLRFCFVTLVNYMIDNNCSYAFHA